MPSIPMLQGRLGDEVVELRPIADWDIPEVLIAHQDDPDMYRRLGLEKPPTGARLGGEVESYPQDLAAGRIVLLTIVEPGLNDCRGRVRAHAINWDTGTADLGIWVAPGYRGRGYARHALRLFSDWLLETVGLQRLRMITDSDNEPLLRAGAAAGFVPRPDGSGGERRLVTLELQRG